MPIGVSVRELCFDGAVELCHGARVSEVVALAVSDAELTDDVKLADRLDAFGDDLGRGCCSKRDERAGEGLACRVPVPVKCSRVPSNRKTKSPRAA
jgi:hypothetical protein